MTMELGGRVTIECKQNNLQAELEFKLKVTLASASSSPQSAVAGVGPGLVQCEASGPPLNSLCAPEMVS